MKKILILHGWTYKLDKWKPFIVSLENEGFEVKILKIPGLTREINKPWTLKDYVSWLDTQVNKNHGKIILLGHSNGGRIAAAYAAGSPGKLSNLILIDSAGVYHRELYLEIKRFLFKIAAKVGKKVTKSESLKRMLYSLAREKDYYNAPLKTKKTMINLVKSDIRPILSKINTPTLIIWGREDAITPLSDAFIFNETIKNSTLKIVEARHSPFFTNTSDVVRIIKDGV